jgi:hypothetical protein
MGYELDSAVFTCDVFLESVPAFCGKPPVAIQWLISGCPERLFVMDWQICVEITSLKITCDEREVTVSDK